MRPVSQPPAVVSSPPPGAPIDLRHVRDLRLREHPEGRSPWISAGSGVAVAGGSAWVVADDELHAGRFLLDHPAAPGELHRVLPGTLPSEPKARKKLKPDIESAIVAPMDGGRALIGVPSGSRENRSLGFLLPLDADGAPAGAARRLDIAPLLASLATRVRGTINIEGSAIVGQRLLLAQRGNGPAGTTNAIIEVPLAQLLPSAGVDQGRGAATGILESAGAAIGGSVSVRDYDLGSLDGVRLGFTDIAALPGGRLAFTAAAERTDDPVSDGRIAGSVVGVIAADGSIEQVRSVADHRLKLEGITPSSGASVLLVADADDPTRPAPMFEAQLPAPVMGASTP